tara:strand:- start:1375 stop:1521 length:147 start_codon:yes stop_codon:yes gene_type:complete
MLTRIVKTIKRIDMKPMRIYKIGKQTALTYNKWMEYINDVLLIIEIRK